MGGYRFRQTLCPDGDQIRRRPFPETVVAGQAQGARGALRRQREAGLEVVVGCKPLPVGDQAGRSSMSPLPSGDQASRTLSLPAKTLDALREQALDGRHRPGARPRSS